MTSSTVEALKPRGPLEHELKTWPHAYDAVEDGLKPWEYRKADRDYRAGDTLWLRKWSPTEGYWGDSIRRAVTFVLAGGAFGIPGDYCIMSLGPHQIEAQGSEGGDEECSVVPRQPTDNDVREILYAINRKRSLSDHLTEGQVREFYSTFIYVCSRYPATSTLTRPDPTLGGRDPYTVQSFADLHSQMESFERNHPDFPNYGDWPIPLPAGHWRAILAADQAQQYRRTLITDVDRAWANDLAATLPEAHPILQGPTREEVAQKVHAILQPEMAEEVLIDGCYALSWQITDQILALLNPTSPWRPMAEAPQQRDAYIDVRSVNTYRWLPYKTDGARQMKKPGRWQRATEYGWENAELPTAAHAEWMPNGLPPALPGGSGDHG